MGLVHIKGKFSNQFYYTLTALVLFCACIGSISKAATIDELSQGRPLHSDVLSRMTFRSITGYKLEYASVVYINHEALEKLGVTLVGQSDHDLKQQILDNFAWVTKHSRSQKTRQKRSFYVDHYGGRGLGRNIGSGRAMITGKFQIKGVGLTPMFKDEIRDDMDGTVSFQEAIKEAVWGEFLNRVLPHGASRVLALISYKNDARPEESSFLIVRESPLRLGHFHSPNHVGNMFDSLRTRRSLSKFSKSLVKVHEGDSSLIYDQRFKKPLSKSEIALAKFLDSWMLKVTQQISKSHFQKIYHGASTESNIMINAALMDFETSTTTSGFDAVQYLPLEQPFTRYSDIHFSWGIGQIAYLLDDSKTSNILIDELYRLYNLYWQNSFEASFLESMGFPARNVSHLLSDRDKHADLLKLINRVISLTQDMSFHPINTQLNDVPDITENIHLDLLMDGFISILEASYSQDIQSPRRHLGYTAKSLNLSQKAFRDILKLWTPGVELSLKSLLTSYPNPITYLRYQMLWQNRIRPELFENYLRDEILGLKSKFNLLHSDETIRHFIIDQVQRAEPNLRDLDLERYVPIAFDVDPFDGSVELEAYNIYDDRTEWMKLDKHGSIIRKEGSLTPQIEEPHLTCELFMN